MGGPLVARMDRKESKMKPVLMIVALTLGPVMALPAYGAAAGAGEAVFEEMDANKDGKVTKEEFAAHRAANQAEVDSDGDGFVTAAEMRGELESRLDQIVARRMARLDKDGDGKLSAEEARQGPRAEKMFAKMDSDGDGVVTLAEARAASAKMDERQAGRAKKCLGGED